MQEHADSRQATKLDLVDIARALGLPGANDRYTVPQLRAIVRAQLEARQAEKQVIDAVTALIRRRGGVPDADLMQAVIDAGHRLIAGR